MRKKYLHYPRLKSKIVQNNINRWRSWQSVHGTKHLFRGVNSKKSKFLLGRALQSLVSSMRHLNNKSLSLVVCLENISIWAAPKVKKRFIFVSFQYHSGVLKWLLYLSPNRICLCYYGLQDTNTVPRKSIHMVYKFIVTRLKIENV